MNKLKLFIENLIVYGFGGVISKMIPIIILPIIVRIMPDSSYYGLSDLSNTMIQFASAIAIMGLYDAMFRLYFDKEDYDYQKAVCSNALIATFFMSIMVSITMFALKNQLARLFFGDEEYVILIYFAGIATLIGSANTIIAAPTRMQNKRKIYLITNILSPLIAYGLAIPMLLKGYHIIAMPVASILSILTLCITFGVLNRKWFSFKLFDKKILKKLLIIGIPLLPNLLIYWIFNSCDKVMITNMIGVNASGIYSVSSKLGHVSQLIYTAFAGGWQYFAFSTMRENNQVKSNSRIFEYMGLISFSITSMVCALSYPIFKLLFTNEYLEGFIAAPYLFLAPLLQMLFQIISNQFLIVKKTWPPMLMLGLGAIVNLILNFGLIPLIGIEGASIATLTGYIVSLVICIIVLYKMRLIVISSKFLFSIISFIAYFCVWRMLLSTYVCVAIVLSLAYIVELLFIYRYDAMDLINKISKIMTKRKKSS